MAIMSKHVYVWLVLSLLIFSGTGSAAQESGKTIHWLSYDAIQQQDAQQSNKKFFVYFFSQHCGYCRLLENKTFKDEAVVDYINANYRPVQINSDTQRNLVEHFGVSGVPDLRFLTFEGKPIARWPGYIEAEQLITLLKFVQTDSYLKMSYSDFKKQE
jgi:thioredoxin-related protein